MKRRIVAWSGVNPRCNHCANMATSVIRHRPTGAIVSAVCKAHDTADRRIDLANGHCPRCKADIADHVDEDTRAYSCDIAIDRLANLAESNLPA